MKLNNLLTPNDAFRMLFADKWISSNGLFRLQLQLIISFFIFKPKFKFSSRVFINFEWFSGKHLRFRAEKIAKLVVDKLLEVPIKPLWECVLPSCCVAVFVQFHCCGVLLISEWIWPWYWRHSYRYVRICVGAHIASSFDFNCFSFPPCTSFLW